MCKSLAQLKQLVHGRVLHRLKKILSLVIFTQLRKAISCKVYPSNISAQSCTALPSTQPGIFQFVGEVLLNHACTQFHLPPQRALDLNNKRTFSSVFLAIFVIYVHLFCHIISQTECTALRESGAYSLQKRYLKGTTASKLLSPEYSTGLFTMS